MSNIVFELFAKLGLDSSEYEKGLGDAKSKASSIGGSIGGALKSAAKVGAAALGAATSAIIAFATSSVKAGQNFDKSMSQVAATMGFTVEQLNATEEQMASMTDAEREAAQAAQESFGQLRDFAQDMGKTTAFSAGEAADALNYMALAGYDTATSMKMLPNVLNLAAAGGIELAEASDMVTDAQSALGLSLDETQELVDKMAKASSKSNTSVAQLGEAMLTIGGTAKNLKGGTTELSQALGLLADNGIKGAEGGTALRNILLNLTPKSEDAAKAMEQIGLKAYDSEGKMRNLKDIFADLNKGMEGMTEEEKTNILSNIFNKVDLKSVNALLATNADRWDELAEAIDDSQGAAEAMAKTQLDNLAGDITLFQSALEGAKIAVSDGLTPTLRQFVQFGTSGLSTITEAFQKGGLSGAMEAFGQVLSDGLDMVIKMLPDAINAGMQLLGALGQGILDNLPAILDAATQIITMLGQGLIEALPALLDGAIQIVEKLGEFLIENIPIMIPAIVELISNLALMLAENAPALIDGAITLITTLAMALIENMPALIPAAIELVVAIGRGIVESIPKLIEAFTKMLDKGLEFLTGSGSDFLSQGVDMLMNLINGFVENLPEIVSMIAEFIAEFAANIAENLPTIIEQGMEILTQLIVGLIQAIPELVAAIPKIIEAIVKAFSKYDWKKIGKDILDGIKKGITGAVSAVVKAAKDAAKAIWDGIKGFFKISSPSKKMMWIGQMVDEGLAEGITDNIRSVDDAMNTLMDFDGNVVDVPKPASSGVSVLSKVAQSGNENKNLTVILELDKMQLGRAVYQLNNAEMQRVGVQLAGGIA